jgi:cation diffusion facilitator CzcD-associated flavoprotein CzcO
MTAQETGAAGMPLQDGEHVDVIIVGAGFAGLYTLHRLRGLGLRARVFEAGTGVGGTWYWNRYPGARCDVPSLEYSFQFSDELQQEWEWTERYATQPEILRYLNHVADRFDLRRDIEFDTRVEAAHFNETDGLWSVTTADGRDVRTRFCIMATGCLSSANLPDIPGRESFQGRTFHTGHWPHEPVDFRGRRVGVIGTGSSAIQSIPLIAQQASELYVFQRTPAYSVPAHNRPLGQEEQQAFKSRYAEYRAIGRTEHPFGFAHHMRQDLATEASAAERQRRFEEYWEKGGLEFAGAYADLVLDERANAEAAAFVRGKIRAIVQDPETAAALSPDYVIGAKRICVDTGYHATFNRPNVHLVDIRRNPIEAITPDGLRAGGRDYVLDDIVFATGFDAMTGSLLKIDIRGRQGVRLRERWSAGPRTYLGLATAGFPNMFFVTGPGSPSVLTNMVPSIEQHVDWIADAIAHLRQHGVATMEAEEGAQEAWVEHVNEVASATLFPRANSWYLGANVPGKPRVFMPYVGFPPYVQKCAEVAARGYEGFLLGGG